MKHSKQRNSKAFQLSQKIMVPILNLFPEKNNARPATRELIVVWLLISLCKKTFNLNTGNSFGLKLVVNICA